MPTDTNDQRPTTNDAPAAAAPVAAKVTIEPAPAAGPAFDSLDAANAEIKRLRDENANRRVSNRDLQTQIADLQKQIPTADIQAQITQLQGEVQRFQAAGEAGISPELLRASDELRKAKTAEEMKTAQEKITRLTAPLGGNGPRNPAPPRQPTQPPSLDEQITAAQTSGNVREAMRLKTLKLTEQK